MICGFLISDLAVWGSRLKSALHGVMVLLAVLCLAECSEAYAQNTNLLPRQQLDSTTLSRRFLTNATLQQMVEFLAFEYPEALTGSSEDGENVGDGYAVFAQKSGTNLQFKTFLFGSGFTITTNTTNVVVEYTAGEGGAGDVTLAGNNTFTGKNTFQGGLIRSGTAGVVTLNWLTNNAASYSATNDITVAFAGSWSTGQLFDYTLTNESIEEIAVEIPESWSIADAAYTTNVVVPADSVAIFHWEYDGELFRLNVEGKNDATLVSLTESGFFRETAQTVDTNKTTIATIALGTNESASVEVNFVASSETNTLSGSFVRHAHFRNDSGTVTQIGVTSDVSTRKTVGATNWEAYVETDGANILVQAMGDAVYPLNWTAQGFAVSYTNGPTLCSRERDSETSGIALSAVTTDQYYWRAVKFTAAGNYKICKAVMSLSRTGSPVGNLTASIYSHDSGGDKPDALVGSASSNVAKGDVPTTTTDVAFSDMVAQLTSNTTYWLILKSGAADDGSNKINVNAVFLGGGSNMTRASDDGGSTYVTDYDQGAYTYTLYSN
jgi:hypothetical protein